MSAPFRLGARAEAPGDLTGILDGRLDSWTLWTNALSESNIQARVSAGLSLADPAPDTNQVDLYVSFEGPYPSVQDGSHNGYAGWVSNHGSPGVAGGVATNGRAFLLNHDQVVDAGWDVTATLQIPTNTPSGMYAVQLLTTPGFAPTQTVDRYSIRAFAIRPAGDAPRAPIAVVLPSNTWNVYNTWPWVLWEGPGITWRSRIPGGTLLPGGCNSVYSEMGDGVTFPNFHGVRRPCWEANPVRSKLSIETYSVRAPNSAYLVRWLDAVGFAYDVFSDDDFDAGLIRASDYRVLMPHSHHEYWSDGMLTTLTDFLDEGGSVVMPAGNVFTWRVVYGTDRVVEAHRTKNGLHIGVADLQSGIDHAFFGLLKWSAICNGGHAYRGGYAHEALGLAIHMTGPSGLETSSMGTPYGFGQWAARNCDHWLWRGSGLSEDMRFGYGRLTNSFAVGHEADTWVEGNASAGPGAGR